MAKRKSRATRLADSVSIIQSQLCTIEERLPVREDDEAAFTADEEKLLAELNSEITNIDVSAIEELRDEITSWRENIEDKFSHTQKYSDLEECEGILTDAIDSIQGTYEGSDFDEVRSAIDDINGYLDEASEASFPRMFG